MHIKIVIAILIYFVPLTNIYGQKVINKSSFDVEIKTEFIPQNITIKLIDYFKGEVPAEADTNGQAFIYFDKGSATIYFPIKKNWPFRDIWNFILGHELGHFFIFCLRNNINYNTTKVNFDQFLIFILLGDEEKIADQVGLFFQKKFPPIIKISPLS